jgi:predicted nucleotidyltransferase
MADSTAPAFAFDRIDLRTSKVTPKLIGAVKERIVSSLHPARVILFGSRALNQAHEDSDVDLLICLDDHHPLAQMHRRDRAGEVLNLFPYRSFGLDVLVLTQSEILDLQITNEGEWDLILEILGQGKVLYESSYPAAAK